MISPDLPLIRAQASITPVAESLHPSASVPVAGQLHSKGGPFASILQSAPQQSYALQQSRGIGRSTKLVGRIAVVPRAHERQDFPQIVGILDDGAERHHRTDDVFPSLAGV